MTQISNIEESIIAYIESTASEEQCKQLLEWLELRPENKKTLFELKHVYDSKNAYRLSEKELESGWKLIEKAIEESHNNKLNRRKRLTRSLSSITRYAAVIAIAALTALGINRYVVSHKPLEYARVVVEAGNKSSVILPDGSKVVLYASSELKYPTSFRDKNREVSLNGEAYFEVTPDKSRPFIVNSQQQSIRVLGTSFNVQSYDRDTINTITLLNGSIQLDLFSTNGTMLHSIRMNRNEQCVFNRVDGEMHMEYLDKIDQSRSWSDGIFRFRNQPMRNIASRLEQYYGVKILIDDPTIMNVRYTGSFSLKQNISEILTILNFDNKFKITNTDDGFSLSRN